MKQIRGRLTYANVMSSLAVFLVLGGATAFAASQLGKNSVGSKQLQKNAVTTAKIKKNAVSVAKIKANAIVTAKIKKNAVTGAKVKAGSLSGADLANGTITGTQINAPTTPFTQVTARLRSPATVPFSGGTPSATLIGSYIQPVGEDDQYLAGLNVNFPASCTGERDAALILLENAPPNLSEVQPSQFVGIAVASDEGSSAKTVRAEFASFSIEGGGAMSRLAPSAPAGRTFSVFPVNAECENGSEDGITATNLGLDVLGTK